MQYIFQILLFLIAYVVTARFGLSLDAVNKFATLVWFPSGIAVAALLLYGFRMFPGVTLGAFIANVATGANPFIASGIAAGNTLEAVIIVYLLKKLHFTTAIDRVKDVLLLFMTLPIGAFLAASFGVLSLFFGRIIRETGVIPTWETWWIGDVVGVLLLTPFLLTIRESSFMKLNPQRMLEACAVVLLTVLISVGIFQEFFRPTIESSPITYLVFLPLIWGALRFGLGMSTMVTFLLSLLAIWGTTRGFGPFAIGRLSERLLLVQTFLSVIAITSLIMGAIVTEWKTLEKRKDEFISMASHELKTPITSLRLYAQLLEKQADIHAFPFYSKMNLQLDKLIRLVDDLLSLSKMQAGKVDFKKEWFDIDECINEIIDVIQSTSKKHKIIVKGNISTKIYADRDQISQVLSNLLSNAVKYSPGAKKVLVKREENKKGIVISIRDYGIGIEKKYQDRVFDRFYQVSEPVEKTFPGLGIGLYISSQIIKRHNGRLWVESKKKKGSIFIFTLPRS